MSHLFFQQQRRKDGRPTKEPATAIKNITSAPGGTITDEQLRSIEELDAEIDRLKMRKIEMQRTLESTPGTSTTTTEFPTITTNQSTMVPVEAMVTLLKQIRSDNKPLPRFSGDVLEWPTFIEEYERTTTEHQFSDSENRERLNKALFGEARLMVQDKLKSTCFLHEAIEELRQKYGGKSNIIKAAVARVEKVRRLGDTLKRIKDFVLDALSIQWMTKNCKVEGLETTLLIKMLDLTPSIMRMKWATTNGR